MLEKDEEISNLKCNAKISKYNSLEAEFKQLVDDFNKLKDQYGTINQNYHELSLIFKFIVSYLTIKNYWKRRNITK